MQKLIYPKIAADMFRIQFFWALGYLGVMLFIHIVKIVASLINNDGVDPYFASVYVTSNIFMLVIGIISTYGFLQYYVENGVTRKDYYKGAALASIGLSLSIPVVTSFISLLEFAIIKMVNINFSVEKSMFLVESEDFGGPINNIIGNVFISVVIPPSVSLSDHWLLGVFVLALNLFFFYLIGWFISTSFYRLRAVGLVSIIVSFVIIFLYDFLLRTLLNLPPVAMFLDIQIPMVVAAIGIIIIIFMTLWMIRQLMKRAPINCR
ncbi:hypothetical protein KDN24_23250 [Bacillus sp. Bva_UNVM-123]|uniref:hypothetical protein n=1 Tax=Bacillus sp. Bva_UNVM-123 TaxID=2829798 RepID=UPI00391FB3BE